jgi:hypothetical protein
MIVLFFTHAILVVLLKLIEPCRIPNIWTESVQNVPGTPRFDVTCSCLLLLLLLLYYY